MKNYNYEHDELSIGVRLGDKINIGLYARGKPANDISKTIKRTVDTALKLSVILAPRLISAGKNRKY